VKDKLFTIKLNRKELAALVVFKPELKQILDDYDNHYNIYVDKIMHLFGVLKYLSEKSIKDELSKIRLLRNLLQNYFFLDSTKNFIAEFFLNNSDYCKFIGYIDSIYRVTLDIIENDLSDEDLLDYQILFKEYLEDLSKLKLTD
jgi:hypothetical protein